VRAAEAAGPIGEDDLDTLFAPVAGAKMVALAVSGGADSLALLLLFDRWRKRPGRPACVVLTVDHRLRPGSRAEARRVVVLAEERGLPARLLSWTGPKPAGDLEAEARRARYTLLLDAAREAGASHLLLAHHQDDQAETFLMRLARGSGVFGLAAMRPLVEAEGVALFRPFLGLPRARLAETVRLAGLVPVEDAMNADPRFARARMRALLPILAEEGIDPSEIAATAARLAEAAEAIDAAAGRLIGEAVTVDAFAVAALLPEPFLAAAAAVRRRVLVRLLMAVGGEPYPPRAERLAALLAAMADPDAGRLKRTLGGTIVEARRDRILFYRESGRRPLPRLKAVRGASFVWDHRFRVTVATTAPAGLAVGPLGEEGRRLVETPPGLPLPQGGRAVAGVSVVCRLSERLAEPPLFPGFPAA
jgi:tRNA(Ile)-lysidine synthase